MSENRPETGGVKESSPNITSKTIEGNGIKKEELDKIAHKDPIKDTATPTHENTLTF